MSTPRPKWLVIVDNREVYDFDDPKTAIGAIKLLRKETPEHKVRLAQEISTDESTDSN